MKKLSVIFLSLSLTFILTPTAFSAEVCSNKDLGVKAARAFVEMLVAFNPGAYIEPEKSIEGARAAVMGAHSDSKQLVSLVKMTTAQGSYNMVGIFQYDKATCDVEFQESTSAIDNDGDIWLKP